MAETARAYVNQMEALPLVGVGLPWVHADAVTELAAARVMGLRAGQAIYDSRVELLRAGDFEQVPYSVDPLSTAGRAREAAERYGAGHPLAVQARYSLHVDSRRLLGEAARKNSWEYYLELEQPYDQAIEDYTFQGRPLNNMVDDGITPVTELEEGLYRLTEKVEEVTYGAIRKLGRLSVGNVVFLKPAQPQPESANNGLLSDINVLTVSECADWAIEAYEKGLDIPLGGYVPQINKLMVRGVRYDQIHDKRYQLQIGVSGEYITHEIITQAQKLLGVFSMDAEVSKQDVRAAQMINVNGQGPLEFIALLDELASQASGKRIFMGEEIPDDQSKDYHLVPLQAAEREKQLDGLATELGEYLMKLEREGVDHWIANKFVEDFAKRQLFKKVKNSPEEAAMIFDEKTAVGVEEVMYLRRRGQEEEAQKREAEVLAAAPPPNFCNPGSCDLYAVAETSAEATIAHALGLRGEIIGDNKRECPDCNTKNVHYDSHGNKACLGCMANEVGGKVSKGIVRKKVGISKMIQAALQAKPLAA